MDSEKAAIELARGDLAKKIRVRISTLASDLTREQGGKTEQEIGRIVTTQADMLLDGVQTVEQIQDPESGMAYAVVALSISNIDHLIGPVGHSDARDSLSSSEVPMAESIWVTAEGIVQLGNDTTLAEAAARSRELARSEAIEKAVGTFVKTQTVVYNTKVAEELVHSVRRGIVIEEKILEQGMRAIGEEKGTAAWLYVTKLRAKVKPVPLERTTDHKIEVLLNRTVFHEGEEVQMAIIPSHDSYVYILNVRQDDGVTVLFPNKFSEDNFLTAKQELIFPNESQRQMGIRLRVILPPGQPKAIEKLKVLATSKRLDLTHDQNQEGIFVVHPAEDQFLVTDLMRQLALLEDTTWSEMTIPYEIRQ